MRWFGWFSRREEEKSDPFLADAVVHEIKSWMDVQALLDRGWKVGRVEWLEDMLMPRITSSLWGEWRWVE